MVNNFLIVVSILEGQNFPRRQDRNLIVEAKFDGELMYTDPVPHDKCPSFNTELAWEVDRKGLQLHRLQRTPIKLQCYAVEPVTNKREALGYLVLDIRLAQEKIQPPKWYSLLNSKYQKQRPGISIALHLEKDERPHPGENGKHPAGNGSKVKQNAVKETEPVKESGAACELEQVLDTSPLKPQLNVESGIYYIGDLQDCIETFVFSVTIAFAADLAELVQLSFPNPDVMQEYNFYYSLFGNDVTTEPFRDYTNPAFPAERASVKIKSRVDILRYFFSQQPNLQIFFLAGDISLGYTDISISQILIDDSLNIDSQAASVEGTFEIHPLSAEQLPGGELASNPQIGVRVMLRKENEDEDDIGNEEKLNSDVSDDVPTNHNSHTLQRIPERQTLVQSDKSMVNSGKKLKEMSNSPPQKLDKVVGLKETAQIIREDIETKGSMPRVSFVDNIAKIGRQPAHVDSSVQQLPMPHHFCFTIDLRTLRLTHQAPQLNVFLRYSYPFFGSTVPILTHPCVEIYHGRDITLPHGYCAFNFATLHNQLESTFREFPLVVEMIHRDKQGNQRDRIIATAKLQLSNVLGESTTTFARENGITGNRRISTCAIPFIKEDRKQIAELLVVMSLDDLGPINIPLRVLESQHSSLKAQSSACNSHNCPHHQGEIDIEKVRREIITKELETWKEQQEALFQEKMKERELHHIQTLTSEWKKRDMERELLMQRKLKEYQQLEDKLKQALSDVEVREHHLLSSESELKRQRTELKQQQEFAQREMKETLQHMKAECDFAIEMERKTTRELKQENAKLQERINELENKLREKEQMINSLKEERDGSVESQLQADVKVLTSEKLDLQKKLENAVAAKQRYKQQWGQALRKIAQLEQHMLEMEKIMWLRKEEYESLQLNRLATAEQGNLQHEKEALSSLRDKVKSFSDQQSETIQAENGTENSPVTTTAPSVASAMLSNLVESNASNEKRTKDFVQRLIEERNTLLSTGVYTDEDRIIVELNEHIQNAMTKKQ